MAYNKYDPYGQTVMNRILAAKRPVKPKVPGAPEEEDPNAMFKAPTLPPEMANLSLPSEMPKAKPLDLSTPKAQAPKVIGAAPQQVIGAAPGTPPPTMAGAPSALDAAGKAIGAGPSITPDMVQPTVLKETFADDPQAIKEKQAKEEAESEALKKQQAAETAAEVQPAGSEGTNQNFNPEYGNEWTEGGGSNQAAPPPPGGGTEDTGGTQDTPEAAALKRMAAEAEKGQDIEDWQKSEEQRAAEALARQVDEAKARMGGTDNPYAALMGIGAQGEYTKRVGEINAKEVEMMLESQKTAANMYTRLEEWNRQNKPDVFNEYKAEFTKMFGMGYKVHYDGSVTFGDGTTKTYEQLSPEEKDRVSSYQNEMGWDETTMDPQKQADEKKKHDDALKHIGTMDSDLDTELNYGDDRNEAEIELANKIADVYATTGKVPTKAEVIQMYNDAGIKTEGSNLEDGSPSSPAW